MMAKLVVPLWMACGLAFGQTPDPAVKFLTASIKPSLPPSALNPWRGGTCAEVVAGEFSCRNVPWPALVSAAFGRGAVVRFRNSPNIPAFDIDARVPEGATREQVKVMLQNLLIDRLKLKYHYIHKPTQAYDLTVAPGGPKLKPSSADSAPDGEPASSGLFLPPNDNEIVGPSTAGANSRVVAVSNYCGGVMQAQSATMADVVRFLAVSLDLPVTDATGLNGSYQFTLAFFKKKDLSLCRAISLSNDGSAHPPIVVNDADVAPSVFIAAQNQLGLKLEPKEKTIDTVVVDQVAPAITRR